MLETQIQPFQERDGVNLCDTCIGETCRRAGEKAFSDASECVRKHLTHSAAMRYARKSFRAKNPNAEKKDEAEFLSGFSAAISRSEEREREIYMADCPWLATEPAEMPVFSGVSADVDILTAIEAWAEENGRFEACWRCVDASFNYSYGGDDGCHKAVEWEFDAPEPWKCRIDLAFPFYSAADGEIYETIGAFVASLSKYIAEEISLCVPGHFYRIYTRLRTALRDDNMIIVTAEAI
jgi:hypothetical protein